MTKEELIDNGYEEVLNKLHGYIYIKNPWFCSIDKDGIVDFRYVSNDMHSVAKISTVKELKEQEILYYKKRRDSYLQSAKELDVIIDLMENVLNKENNEETIQTS